MRKSTKILFTLSVLLNVVLIGAVTGRVIKDFQSHPWQEVREDLSPEGRSIVARNFQAAHRQMAETFKDARKIREKLVDIFKADEFDPDAFDAEMEKMRVLQDKMHAVKVESLKDLATSLPQEERIKMADKLVRSMEPRRPGQYRKHRENAFKREAPANFNDMGSPSEK